MEGPQLYITVPEAGELLGLAEATVRNYLSDGSIRFVKEKSRTLIPMEALDEFMRSYKRQRSPAQFAGNFIQALYDLRLKRDPLVQLLEDFEAGVEGVAEFVSRYPYLEAELKHRVDKRKKEAASQMGSVLLKSYARRYFEDGPDVLNDDILKDAPPAVINTIKKMAAEMKERVDAVEQK
jgi:excisionase family DNA binding protein